MTSVDPLGGLGAPARAPAPAPPRPPARAPPKTPTAWALVAVLFVFFVFQSAIAGWDTQDPLAIFRLGGLNWPAVVAGDFFRIGSYSFLHFGVIHFVLNAWALWILMRIIESAYGSVSALGIYALAVLAGGAASMASAIHDQNPVVLSAGASGGIAGLFGAFIAVWLRMRKRLSPEAARATLWMVLINLGLNVAVAWEAGAHGLALDNSAHLGGLAAGLVAGLVAPLVVVPRRFWSRPAQVVLVLATFALASMEGAAVSRALHPHLRRLAGDGVSAQAPWMLIPAVGLVALTSALPWLQLPVSVPGGVAQSPGGIGLTAFISRSNQPMRLDPSGEALEIGERTWLRVRAEGDAPDQEAQVLTARQGAGTLVIRVVCESALCHGDLADAAAIELAKTFHVD